VVAAGYSSGAHLAAGSALLPVAERKRTSCRPNALVLYAGVLERSAADLSPIHHVGRNAPPALLLCGDRDSLVGQSRRFAQVMNDAGKRAELALFPGGHKAFTSQLSNPVLAPSLARVDEFLVSLGYVDPVTDLDGRIADLRNYVPTTRRRTRPAGKRSDRAG
jgi:acetyl esterase/lipase